MHSQFYPEQQFSLVYKIRNQRRHLKHFGKVGRIASEDVITELLNAQCLPALYYGLEACPVNKSQMRSLEYVLNNSFRKIFATKSFDTATDCVLYFGCAVQDTLCRRNSKCFMKLRYKPAVSICVENRVRRTCRASEIDVIMLCLESVLFVYLFYVW